MNHPVNPWALACCALAGAAGLLMAAPAASQGTVGIRVSTSNVDVASLAADLDLTMYTRGYGPAYTTPGGAIVAYVGSPFLGYPALDYGDGNTLSTATLALTNAGGGPGGSTVYRSLASFSHSYPALGSYTARATMACNLCFRVSYVFFPPGSPVPSSFTGTRDYRPGSVIGNQPLQLTLADTIKTFLGSYSVRYQYSYSPVVTNSAEVSFEVREIPTSSAAGLAVLALALMAAGFVLLRRL